jgi:PPOX class probable F420-dependent enzyme
MEFEDIRSFLEGNHRAIVQTIRPSGAVHASAVVCGAYQGYMALASVYPRSQKVRNLRRNPQCTVLAITPDWRHYAVVEGKAELKGSFNTDAEELRLLLRDIFRACSGSEHPNWEEYDEAMVKQESVAILVTPETVYAKLG